MKISRLEQLAFDLSSLLSTKLNDVELVSSLLGNIGTSLSCGWATRWRVNSAHQSLDPVVTWNAEGVLAPKLELHTKNRRLSLSEGNAGHVWRTRKPIWSNDFVRDMCLPRSIDASEAGLSGGIWFALKTDSTVYGVIEILGENLGSSTDKLLLPVESIGLLIGKRLKQTWKITEDQHE